MKKLNKKGFLIAESIIVGVFVLSLFTFLFVNVVPLVGQYEAREKYDTINGAYNANLVRTMILEDNKMEQEFRFIHYLDLEIKLDDVIMQCSEQTN